MARLGANCVCRKVGGRYDWRGAGACDGCGGRKARGEQVEEELVQLVEDGTLVFSEDGKSMMLAPGVGGLRFGGRGGQELAGVDVEGVACAVRFELMAAVIPADKLGELLLTCPHFSALGYWKAACREACRECMPMQREELGRVLEQRHKLLMDAHVRYRSDADLVMEGLRFGGSRYSAIVGRYDEAWRGEGGGEVFEPWFGEGGLLLGGVYDREVYCDDAILRANSSCVTAAMVSMGYWDWLVNDGRCFRPLPKHHMPLVYYGAYGVHGVGDVKDFAGYSGDWGCEKAWRGEEGEGMWGRRVR